MTAVALERLWEREPDPRGPAVGGGMPAALLERYGGTLAIPLRADRPTIVANFVSTLDGIVSFGSGDLSGGGLISGFHEPDRFVMGLLRSMADAVVVGAGTLRGSTSHRWIPEHVHPSSADAYHAWRTTLGAVGEQPTTIVVTGSGDIPTDHAGLKDPRVPVIIATTRSGAARLRDAHLAPHARVAAIGSGRRVTPADLVALGRDLGARLLLSEGGPHLIGDLVEADLLDELFLTMSPQLVGRGDPQRLGLVEGVALPPDATRWQELISVRRSADHLFLRYRRAS